jgi:hypothetical protein
MSGMQLGAAGQLGLVFSLDALSLVPPGALAKQEAADLRGADRPP